MNPNGGQPLVTVSLTGSTHQSLAAMDANLAISNPGSRLPIDQLHDTGVECFMHGGGGDGVKMTVLDASRLISPWDPGNEKFVVRTVDGWESGNQSTGRQLVLTSQRYDDTTEVSRWAFEQEKATGGRFRNPSDIVPTERSGFGAACRRGLASLIPTASCLSAPGLTAAERTARRDKYVERKGVRITTERSEEEATAPGSAPIISTAPSTHKLGTLPLSGLPGNQRNTAGGIPGQTTQPEVLVNPLVDESIDRNREFANPIKSYPTATADSCSRCLQETRERDLLQRRQATEETPTVRSGDIDVCSSDRSSPPPTPTSRRTSRPGTSYFRNISNRFRRNAPDGGQSRGRDPDGKTGRQRGMSSESSSEDRRCPTSRQNPIPYSATSKMEAQTSKQRSLNWKSFLSRCKRSDDIQESSSMIGSPRSSGSDDDRTLRRDDRFDKEIDWDKKDDSDDGSDVESLKGRGDLISRDRSLSRASCI